MVKNQESSLLEKKRQIEDNKRMKARYELEQKIMEENQVRMNAERDVSRMEQTELDLIQKLQNTQQEQKVGK